MRAHTRSRRGSEHGVGREGLTGDTRYGLCAPVSWLSKKVLPVLYSRARPPPRPRAPRRSSPVCWWATPGVALLAAASPSPAAGTAGGRGPHSRRRRRRRRRARCRQSTAVRRAAAAAGRRAPVRRAALSLAARTVALAALAPLRARLGRGALAHEGAREPDGPPSVQHVRDRLHVEDRVVPAHGPRIRGWGWA